MKSLSDVAEYGKGSAARPLTRRTDRFLSRRVARLIGVSIVAGVIALVAARLVIPGTGAGPAIGPTGSYETGSTVDAVAPLPTPTPTTTSTYLAGALPQERREYAIALHELRGLPLDIAPGTALEVWVSWDDAFTKGPQVQRLMKKASLARMIEPVTPEGPVVAVLSVPESSLGDLVYGDLFGSLAVAIPTD